MNIIIFYVILFFTNILQGVTGFGSSAVSMPFGLMLVGYATAKPVLSLVGLCGGLYVMITDFRHINWRWLGKILVIMAVGMAAALLVRDAVSSSEKTLSLILGIFVIILALRGLWKLFAKKAGGAETGGFWRKAWNAALIVLSGFAQGVFVSGGPLLVSYMTDRMQNKEEFRATVSCVWVATNIVTIISDALHGMWTPELIGKAWPAVPILAAAMSIGALIGKKLNKKTFLTITYALLLLSGVILLFR